MSTHVVGLTTEDLAEIVEALLTAADHADDHAPELAARRRELAECVGDALDELPEPAVTP